MGRTILDLANDILGGQAAAILLVAVRAGAMLMVAPVFGHRAVPVKLRLGMGLVLAVGVAGRLVAPAAPAHPVALAAALLTEAGVGLLLGCLARLVFVGVEIGAWHVAQQMGVGLAESYAAGAPGGGLALLGTLATVIFLAIGGHRELISALVLSLRAAPAGGLVSPSGALAAAVSLLGVAMVVALKVAAPVLAALLLTGLALGILQRTAPQLNVLSTNLPARALVGLAVLAAGLAALPAVVNWAWGLAAGEIGRLMVAGGAP